jgi:manganese/zinc/iron transport system permease protein
MASATGFVFGLAFLFAPRRGLLAIALRLYRQKWEFAQRMLAIHLSQHESTPQAEFELRMENLEKHFLWAPNFARRAVRRAERAGILFERKGRLYLTEAGRKLAQETIAT